MPSGGGGSGSGTNANRSRPVSSSNRDHRRQQSYNQEPRRSSHKPSKLGITCWHFSCHHPALLMAANNRSVGCLHVKPCLHTFSGKNMLACVISTCTKWQAQNQCFWSLIPTEWLEVIYTIYFYLSLHITLLCLSNAMVYTHEKEILSCHFLRFLPVLHQSRCRYNPVWECQHSHVESSKTVLFTLDCTHNGSVCIFLCSEAYRSQEPSPDHSSGSESGSDSSRSRSQSPSSSGSSSSEEGSKEDSVHGNAPSSEAPQSSNRSSALCLRNISARSGGIRYLKNYKFSSFFFVIVCFYGLDFCLQLLVG